MLIKEARTSKSNHEFLVQELSRQIKCRLNYFVTLKEFKNKATKFTSLVLQFSRSLRERRRKINRIKRRKARRTKRETYFRTLRQSEEPGKFGLARKSTWNKTMAHFSNPGKIKGKRKEWMPDGKREKEKGASARERDYILRSIHEVEYQVEGEGEHSDLSLKRYPFS